MCFHELFKCIFSSRESMSFYGATVYFYILNFSKTLKGIYFKNMNILNVSLSSKQQIEIVKEKISHPHYSKFG